MSLLRHGVSRIDGWWGVVYGLLIAAAAFPIVSATGCSDRVQLPSDRQMAEFRKAGPSGPTVDMDQVVESTLRAGPYRVSSGEVLEVTLSSFLGTVTAGQTIGPDQITPFVCRINDSGRISLPVVGELPVAGQTLPEIEASVIRAYYPAYAKTYPSVFVKLLEPKKYKVSITGAVKTPGVYALRCDQMSLVSLLMEAGGIAQEGAASIRVIRSDSGDGMGLMSSGPRRAASSDLGTMAGRLRDSEYETPGVPIRLASWVSPVQGVDDSDWYMSFRAEHGQTTVGWLSIGREGRFLIHERLDVASEVDRWALLRRLAARDPGLSVTTLERRLAGLASALNPGGRSPISDISLCSQIDRRELMAPPRPSLVVPVAEMRSSGPAAMPGGQGGPTAGQSSTLMLPIKGINIPFADVALQEGDRVIVERLVIPLFTVIGLVNRPGNFEYPPDAHYNMIQALGFAGGLDIRLDPRYAIVYRLNPDGSIVHTAFQLSNPKEQGALAMGASVAIKPGDIIAVEHTPRTRTKEFLDRIFNVNVGAYIPLMR